MTDTRPRVLVLIKGLGIGGAEKLISEGARFWDRDAFNYEVAYVLPWKDNLVPDLERLDIPVHLIGGERGLTPPTLIRLRRLIRDNEFDLVHAHLPTMGVISRLVSPVPVVYTEHNMAESYRPLTRTTNRLTYRMNSGAMAVSGAVATSVSEWPGPPVQVIPNGVAVSVDADGPQRARDELGLGADDPLVAHVGNIRPGKGHDNLVAAAAQVRDEVPGARIVSIGGEKYPGDLDRVRKLAADSGVADTVSFLGRRPDALDFVAASDIFVNPSSVEGLPVAILEAMSLGRPVVATAVGGVPGLVKDEETGLLVDPDDPAALAAGVVRLLLDRTLADRLGEAGRETVETDYGLEPMVRATEDVYRQVLNA